MDKNNDFLYRELSYQIIGVAIEVHKEQGSFAREKQYCDSLEKKFRERKWNYERELRVADSGNILDFVIENSIVVECKAVPYLITEHYDQVKRYLHQSGLKLGILINFRDKRLKPRRVLNSNNLQNS